MVKIIILLFAGIYVVAHWIYMHPICLVCGLSMYPTFDDGSIILTKRVDNLEIEKGEIYVFKRLTSEGKTLRVIKRVHDLEFKDGKMLCYILGDNPSMSYDSREYGYIDSEDVVAKVTKILRY
ncbi:MAG: signal peptidase I [Romboutsia sp.]